MDADGHQDSGTVETAGSTTSKGVSFTVDFDEVVRKPSRPPKGLAQRQKQAKPKITEASLEEKLRLADERRQVR